MFRDNEVFWGTFFTVIVFALVVSWWDIDTAPITHMLGQLWDWAHDPTPLINGFQDWLMWALGAGGMVVNAQGIRARFGYALAWLWSVAGYRVGLPHVLPERLSVRLDAISGTLQGNYYAYRAYVIDEDLDYPVFAVTNSDELGRAIAWAWNSEAGKRVMTDDYAKAEASDVLSRAYDSGSVVVLVGPDQPEFFTFANMGAFLEWYGGNERALDEEVVMLWNMPLYAEDLGVRGLNMDWSFDVDAD